MSTIADKPTKFDAEFKNSQPLSRLLKKYDVEACPVPARRSHNPVIERKHREIRKFFRRLVEEPSSRVARGDADQYAIVRCAAIGAAMLSNLQYGSKIASAFEMLRGYTPIRDVASSRPQFVPSLP